MRLKIFDDISPTQKWGNQDRYADHKQFVIDAIEREDIRVVQVGPYQYFPT